MNRALCVWLAMAVGASVASADWPQFQGPNRDGVSTETVKLADSWPADGPRVVWKIDGQLGTGFGGPVVAGGKVYLLDRVNDQQDMLRCIDLASGKQEWTYAYFAPPEAKDNPKAGGYKGNYNGSRNLPAVDATGIYTLGPFGDVTCVNAETHQAVWTTNIIQAYGADLGNWGICQSPVLYKSTVIVAPLSKTAGMVAFDKASGAEVWKSERVGEIAWTSPFISTVDGVDQVVMLNSRGEPRLVSVDAATGRKLWIYNGWKCPNPIASHTDCGQGRFFITGGYKAGSVMVQVSKDGDNWKVQELFRSKDCGAQACKPVFFKDHIYAKSNDFMEDGAKSGNGLVCLDMTGNLMWKTSNDNIEEIGSILIADGKIYNFFSEKGNLSVVRAAPERYEELGTAKVTSGSNLWGPMAISDGKLLIRSRRSLICLDVSAGGGAAK